MEPYTLSNQIINPVTFLKIQMYPNMCVLFRDINIEKGFVLINCILYRLYYAIY